MLSLHWAQQETYFTKSRFLVSYAEFKTKAETFILYY
ncbi:hypothetical protein BSP4_39410 [Bacillus subtilis subsp. subtilis]|nr:hypothetical protein BSP4_39410 [Bacillus subtilis subsp. subtilis]